MHLIAKYVTQLHYISADGTTRQKVVGIICTQVLASLLDIQSSNIRLSRVTKLKGKCCLKNPQNQ
jgi:hypothetical protein